MLKNKRIILFLCMLLFVFNTMQLIVYAETKQTEITSLSKQGDLTVMFTFDKEIVDIDFISPSGKVISSDSSEVEIAQGDLWSTYRIKNAEQGTWKVEYDLKSNSEISYSIIKDDYGLWIQYLNLGKNDGDELELVFKTDFDEEDIYYSYEIYAVSLVDTNAVSKLSSGLAKANEEKTIDVNLNQLSSDEYVIRLDAFYDDDGMEVFDSVLSDSIEYVNPNEPSAIEDYKVKIDMDEHICLIDWSEFVDLGYSGYKLIVAADGETVYNSEMENNIQSNSVLFSEGTKSIEVKLAYKSNNVWSKYNIKTISLEDEFLTNTTGNITNSSQIELQYKTKMERVLRVKINDEEGKYKVKEEGTLSFDLKDEVNEVYAELELDNQIYFIVDQNVYSDRIPPSITLYDNLDGKTFYTDSATILGKISGGKILKINENEINVDETGSFAYEVNLSLGENVIEIICEDANGNGTSRVLTIYRGTSIFNAKENTQGLLSYLPLLASVLVSILTIILAVVFMKRKDKSLKKKYSIVPYLVWDILVATLDAVCWWQFITRYFFSNSIKYLKMAEKSLSQAAIYIRLERLFGITAIAALIIFALSITLTILVAKKRKK